MKSKKWFSLDSIFDKLNPRQCAVTIKDNDKFYLYGEPLCSTSQTNMIICRIEGAGQLVKDFQVVVSFCKL